MLHQFDSFRFLSITIRFSGYRTIPTTSKQKRLFVTHPLTVQTLTCGRGWQHALHALHDYTGAQELVEQGPSFTIFSAVTGLFNWKLKVILIINIRQTKKHAHHYPHYASFPGHHPRWSPDADPHCC